MMQVGINWGVEQQQTWRNSILVLTNLTLEGINFNKSK